MLRSRRATSIQNAVDGATTEDRADRRQDHRLRVSATEHLNGKSRTRGERDRELGAVVCCGAGIEQKPCVGGLTSLDAFDDLGPFALELTGILDRGRLGSTGGGNLGGIVGLGLRCRNGGRRGGRNGLRRRSRRRLRCRRCRLGSRHGRRTGRRLSRRSGSTTVPRHTALARGRISGGSRCRRSGSSGTRDKRRLLGGSGYGCCRRGGLSSSHARRHRGIGNHGLQACHALGQCLNRYISLGTCQTRAGNLEHQAHVARAPHLQCGIVEHRQHAGQAVGRMLAKGSGLGSKRLGLLGAALKQLGTGTGNAGNIHVAHVRHQVARQLQQVVSFLDLRTNQSIELGNIAIGNGAGKLAQNLVRNLA